MNQPRRRHRSRLERPTTATLACLHPLRSRALAGARPARAFDHSVQTFVVFTAASAFRLSLVDTVALDGHGGRRRLGVDDGALLGARIAHDEEFCSTGGLRAESERGESAADDKLLLHVFLLHSK